MQKNAATAVVAALEHRQRVAHHTHRRHPCSTLSLPNAAKSVARGLGRVSASGACHSACVLRLPPVYIVQFKQYSLPLPETLFTWAYPVAHMSRSIQQLHMQPNCMLHASCMYVAMIVRRLLTLQADAKVLF